MSEKQQLNPFTNPKGSRRFSSPEMLKLDEEMGTKPENVTPQTSTKFRDLFTTATTDYATTDGCVISIVGNTGSGKTTFTMTQTQANEKDCIDEINTWDLAPADHKVVVETLCHAYETKYFLPVKEVFILGTEKSTLDCIKSLDNQPKFSSFVKQGRIHYKEIFVRGQGNKALENTVDAIASIKKFNEIMVSLEDVIEEERKNQIGFTLDSGSTLLGWCNEVIRRNTMQIPKTAKEQGVPPHYWFWRNTKMESTSLTFRDFNIPIIQTWKIKKNKEGKYTDDPAWHETSGHYSSIWINSTQIPFNNNNYFVSTFKKNRFFNGVVNHYYPFITANLLYCLSLRLEKHLKKLIKIDANLANKLSWLQED